MTDLKMARLANGLSQVELCYLAKIKRYRLSQLELGEAAPNPREHERLIIVLGPFKGVYNIKAKNRKEVSNEN